MFNLHTYTIIHVLISLAAIVSGMVVTGGLFESKRLPRPTRVFLSTTALTALTGFGFPFDHLLPSHIVGLLTLAMLIVAVYARYSRGLAGVWRWIYVVGAMTAFYFNVFVFVVQTFRRIPMLHSLAPRESEPPFAFTQLAVLVVFLVLTVITTTTFHPERRRSMTAAL